MSEADSSASSADSRTAVNDGFLSRIRGQQHVGEDLEQLYERGDRVTIGHPVVGPSIVVQLPDLAVRDAQVFVSQLESSNVKVGC